MVSGGVRATSLANHTVFLPGGGLRLRLSPRVEVGGVAWALPSNLHLPEAGVDLGFGYGGFLVRVQPVRERPALGVTLLVGALNAVVHDAVVGTEIDADNALVVEPDVAMAWRLAGRVRVQASAGWRLAWGVNALPGVAPSELRGWTLGLSLHLGPF